MATAKPQSDLACAHKHKYRVEPGGAFVPGVTTIMNILDKPALKWASSKIAAESAVLNSRRKKAIVKNHREWLIKTGRGPSDGARAKFVLGSDGSDDEVFIHWARGEFDRQWRAKANRGTRVHDVAERWSKGETVDVLPEDSGFVDALDAFHQAHQPHFELVECVVLNKEHEYGGRFDGIVGLKIDGVWGTYLIDYKTGGEYTYEVATQAAGYWGARLGSYDASGTLTGFTDLPDLDGARTIYLREDGTFGVSDPFAKITREDAWQAFIAARELYRINSKINASLDLLEGESE